MQTKELKNEALIEYEDVRGVLHAINYLWQVRIMGSDVKVRLSNRNLTSNGVQSPTSQKQDFSKLNRCKANSQNWKNIGEPGNILHVSNLHPSVVQKNIEEVFSRCGKVEDIKFFPDKTKRMAYVTMNSKDEAIEVIIKCHNLEIASQQIKITFAKNGSKKRSSKADTNFNQTRPNESSLENPTQD
eukprot:TRINITY_DN19969_c0_g1_i1.p1 TRINITY_DN19969_c0_g1~~TRINITY_DN19969_c0_g1_i1.p1  ORF type:complete len:186 (-),score=28.04 TRINITY_DN19969_c0_g1_i1:122-679(-)